MFNKKGITLIALVVTIIILLILAAVSIALIIGPDGVIEKTRETKIASRYSAIMDRIYTRDASLEVAFKMGEDGEGQEEFIQRLVAEGLLFEGEYDEETYRTIYLGEQKDGTFKYTLNIADGTENGKIIADMINNLPDTDEVGNEVLKNMALIIRTDYSNETVELPISNTIGLTINWDTQKNPNNFVNPNRTTDPTYTYSQAGEYEVQIKGTCLSDVTFGGYSVVDMDNEIVYENRNIVELKAWGENGFKKIRTVGTYLEGTIPLPSKKSFDNIESFDYTFAFFESLHSIPPELFVNCPSVKEFAGTFGGCETIQNIPKNLFINCPNVTSFYGTFGLCTSLEEIPANLFKNCPNVTTFMGTFYICESLKSIPSTLFSKATKATNFLATFHNCVNIKGIIPSNLFANCPEATIFYSTFEWCRKIEGIPANLFANCPKVTHFEWTFNGCYGVTEIPEGLFDSCTEVESFYHVFYYCTNLTTVPENLFDNCLKVSNFEEAFYNCYSLTGNVPELWTRNNVVNKDRCFAYCYNALNYDDIPSDWK